MKIADFGLARNVRDLEYYRKTTDVRWLVASERVFFFAILEWNVRTLIPLKKNLVVGCKD